jgi:hypothetical protein
MQSHEFQSASKHLLALEERTNKIEHQHHSHLFMPGYELVLRQIRVSFHLMDCWANFAVGKQGLGLCLAEV